MPENAAAISQDVKGVFATETVTTVGFGATKRRVKQSVYVYAEEDQGGGITCQPLNENFIATGDKQAISREELFQKFVPAPHVYLNKFLPAKRALEQAVDNGDRCREQGQLFTAEFEYKNALRIDENHVRASFGLGLTYLEHGDSANAAIVFRKLSTLKGAMAPEFKHLFNEFGIKLRKNRMYVEAVRHYSKAVHMSPGDEHLLCNLARALYEKGNPRAAKRFLDKALAIRPDFSVARKFRAYILEKSLETIPESHLPVSAAPGPDATKARKGENS